MELPAVNLKAILLVHWLLTTWGGITFSDSYVWANYAILALGVWAIAQRDSIDAISMFLGGLVVTIFLDIIHISIFYPLVVSTDSARFGAGMAILSLLLKPFSCCLVYQMYRERGGELLLHVGFLGPSSSQERGAYQTIGEQEVPSDPFAGPESRNQMLLYMGLRQAMPKPGSVKSQEPSGVGMRHQCF
ncbi:PREDICTED: type-1 angiotensin II receptor-associated protein [Elephantulus edwardii]|uniref:type-1 angiotensin II receptor-associated protein n=1 Tax=Elephantulus edwardii TaxID=28737 RepID=UPI0003F0E1D2|nr:PREDICTED: type-1 angiotensin II receptor-associated protein [Elephantulus edwardii]